MHGIQVPPGDGDRVLGRRLQFVETLFVTFFHPGDFTVEPFLGGDFGGDGFEVGIAEILHDRDQGHSGRPASHAHLPETHVGTDKPHSFHPSIHVDVPALFRRRGHRVAVEPDQAIPDLAEVTGILGAAAREGEDGRE